MVDDPEAALLAAVHANPEGEQARAVYADWLEGRGDPRGEYLRLELQRVSIPRRIAELVTRIEPDWIRMVHGKFRIWITSYGDRMILAIRVVRELTGIGLREAKELVASVSEATPALLFDEVELERVRQIVKHCEGAVALRIEPSLPSIVPVSPPLRRYRLSLVGVIDPQRLIGALRHHTDSEEDAHAVIAQIAAGTPFELARFVDAADAAELAVQFHDLAMVRTERVPHGG